MHASVITLFPALLEAYLATSVMGRAVVGGLVQVDLVDLRTYGEGPHRQVDDRPFGGGPGMVLMAEPVIRAVEDAREGHEEGVRTLVLSPQGRAFDQGMARELAGHEPGFVLVCGRYEGIDERALEVLEPEEVSLGDFVLSGGEVAAMAVLDATARLVPGVLGHDQSAEEDSFSAADGILDHPHYTRPASVRGLGVPEILRGGDHAAVARWRREQAVSRTQTRRPDLLGDGEPHTQGGR